MSAELNDVTSRRRVLRKAGAATLAAAGGAAMLADSASAQSVQVVLVPFGPQRVYDTRQTDGRIFANQQRTLGGAAAPSEFAHIYNVTITETQGAGGYLAVFPGDITWPGSSTLNWFGAGQMLANSAYTWLAESDQSIRIRAGGPAGSSTHVVLDLVGVLTLVDLGVTAQSVRELGGAVRGTARQLHSLGSEPAHGEEQR